MIIDPIDGLEDIWLKCFTPLQLEVKLDTWSVPVTTQLLPSPEIHSFQQPAVIYGQNRTMLLRSVTLCILTKGSTVIPP